MNENTTLKYLKEIRACLSRKGGKKLVRDLCRRTLAQRANFVIVPLGVSVKQLLEMLDDPLRHDEVESLLNRIGSVIDDIAFRDGLEGKTGD
jgi:hypothetical protein